MASETSRVDLDTPSLNHFEDKQTAKVPVFVRFFRKNLKLRCLNTHRNTNLTYCMNLYETHVSIDHSGQQCPQGFGVVVVPGKAASLEYPSGQMPTSSDEPLLAPIGRKAVPLPHGPRQSVRDRPATADNGRRQRRHRRFCSGSAASTFTLSPWALMGLTQQGETRLDRCKQLLCLRICPSPIKFCQGLQNVLQEKRNLGVLTLDFVRTLF